MVLLDSKGLLEGVGGFDESFEGLGKEGFIPEWTWICVFWGLGFRVEAVQKVCGSFSCTQSSRFRVQHLEEGFGVCQYIVLYLHERALRNSVCKSSGAYTYNILYICVYTYTHTYQGLMRS